MAVSTAKTKRQLIRDMATSMGLGTDSAHTISESQSPDDFSSARLALTCATVRELHAAQEGANRKTAQAFLVAQMYFCYSTITKTMYRFLSRQERERLNRRATSLLKHPDVTADAKKRLQNMMQAVVDEIIDFDERGRQETTLPIVEDSGYGEAAQAVSEKIQAKVFGGVVYAGLKSDWPEEGRQLWEQARTSWVFPIGTRFINAMTKQLQEDNLLSLTAAHDKVQSDNTTMEQLEEDNDRDSTSPRKEEAIQAEADNHQSNAESFGEDSVATSNGQPKKRRSVVPGASKGKRSRRDQNAASRLVTNAPRQREGDILAGFGAYTKLYEDSSSAMQAFYQGRWKPADDDQMYAEIDYDELVEEIYDAMCAMPDDANDFQLKMLRDVEKKIASLSSPKETLTQIAAMLAQALLDLYTLGTPLRSDQLKGLRQTAGDKIMSAEKRKDVILRVLKATKRKVFHLLERYDAIIRFVAAPESEEAIILHNKAENDARRDKKKAAEKEIFELKTSRTANASKISSTDGAQEQMDEDEDGDVIVVSGGAVG
ncbi:hypothetical protein KC340_g6590 [Hortaea werneckii]|nr:hypothetical protein KC340_g6590 [Hortaea werneckii]KAI7403531.1 hypothetical protein KC328_g2316 [Hortaea werneckii]